MKPYQISDFKMRISLAGVMPASVFLFIKATTFPEQAVSRFIMITTLALGLSFASNAQVKGKIPDAKKTNFFKSYAHPNQSRISFSAGIGFGAYSGDICRLNDGKLQHHYFNPGLSAGLSYRFTNFISARWDNGYQMLRARSRPDTWGDWSFRSHTFASTAGLQINFISKTRQERDRLRWDAYLMGGGGILFYQTKSSFNTEKYGSFDLLLIKPTQTIAAVFPVGLGGSRYLGNQWSLGLECIYHFTTTDLLDGASLINDPNPRKDDYLTIQVYVTHQLFQLFRYKEYMKRK